MRVPEYTQAGCDICLVPSRGASRYDVRNREGGHGKADVVREIARILQYESFPNVDKGEGVRKAENFADVINGCTP